jgi:hypothetical protein
VAKRVIGLPEWKKSAACNGQPVEFFFEERYTDLAKEFCSNCEVKKRCYGTASQRVARGDLVYGIWGGRDWSPKE